MVRVLSQDIICLMVEKVPTCKQTTARCLQLPCTTYVSRHAAPFALAPFAAGASLPRWSWYSARGENS
jgi:hypothetical protein